MDEHPDHKKTEEIKVEMKKVETVEPDTGKKISSTTITIIIALILIAILLGLVFVPKYIAKKQLENNKYNGFSFVKQGDGFWYTVVNKGNQPFSIPFYYHPRDLEDIIVEPNLRNKFFNMRDVNGTVYVTIDPDSENNKVVIAGVEIARILGDRYGLLNVKTRSGFSHQPLKTTTNTETPIITCGDQNNQTLVVIIAITDKNIVYSKDNCVVVQAKSFNETVQVADRLVYHILGIMN